MTTAVGGAPNEVFEKKLFKSQLYYYTDNLAY